MSPNPKAFFRGVWRAVVLVVMIAAGAVAAAGVGMVLLGVGVTVVGYCLLAHVHKSWAWL